MKIIEVQQGFIILSQAKIQGLTTEQTYKVLDVARTLKKTSKEFEDFIKDVQEKITDPKEQNEILSKEAEKEVDIKIEKLGKETFDKLLDLNSWNVSQAMLLEDLIR